MFAPMTGRVHLSGLPGPAGTEIGIGREHLARDPRTVPGRGAPGGFVGPDALHPQLEIILVSIADRTMRLERSASCESGCLTGGDLVMRHPKRAIRQLDRKSTRLN